MYDELDTVFCTHLEQKNKTMYINISSVVQNLTY